MKKNFLKKYIFFKIFDKYILENAWKVQFLGKSEFIYIDSMVKNINKIIIPNGQDLNELKFEYKNLKNDDDLIFGFVGRIDKFHKGLDLLIEGYKIYKEQNGKAKLWIVGDGQDLEYLKKYTKENNLQDLVTFFGSKFGSEKLNLMKNMDVFIHTSRFEGFPMAILEAFGLNIPVLISDETNVGEYVIKYNIGVLLKKNDPNEIAKEMLNLNKEIINQWKENIPNMVSKEFMWTEISKRIIE
jgi:glycosyltransferase involved in cell wall biosynthesis